MMRLHALGVVALCAADVRAAFAAPAPSPPGADLAFDPHLTFAHGGKADIKGEHNTWYNLLSGKGVSLNVLFTNADFHLESPRQQLVHGSRMERMCLTVRTEAGRIVTVEYNATATPASTALVTQRGGANARLLARLASAGEHSGEHGSQTHSVENLHVSLRSRHVGGHLSSVLVAVIEGKWQISAWSMPFPSPKSSPGLALLNVQIEALYDADHDVVAPHGLIGQSYDGDEIAVHGKLDDYSGAEVTTSAMAEGAIVGSAHDYAMSGPYSTSFKYSRFDATSAPRRDVSQLTGVKVASPVLRDADDASMPAALADDSDLDG